MLEKFLGSLLESLCRKFIWKVYIEIFTNILKRLFRAKQDILRYWDSLLFLEEDNGRQYIEVFWPYLGKEEEGRSHSGYKGIELLPRKS